MMSTRIYKSIFAGSVISVLSIATFSAAQDAGSQNPYAPSYGHPYRAGAVPTREADRLMKEWAKEYGPVRPPSSSVTLTFGGGIDGIGVTSGIPKVYLVVYGSQWGTAGTDSNGNVTLSGDSSGEVPRLQQLYKGFGTGGELWSATSTQYCDGSLVGTGATSCPAGASHVDFPSGGVLAGVWYDNSTASPSSADGAQLADEAINAAAHFGNTTAASNRYAQYVIASPPGTNPDGFPNTGFCAWHAWNGYQSLTGGPVSSPYGPIAFTNFPYVTAAGTGCGENAVNSGSAGLLDGVTIVGGHEYAETLSDQLPFGGWDSHSGEDGDECAWIKTGQGAMANVGFATGSFAMQSIWSNDSSLCEMTHFIVSNLGSPTLQADQNTDCPQILVSWSAVSGATYYNLYRATSGSTAWPGDVGNPAPVVYSGTALQTDQPNPPRGLYSIYIVAACNASGCSEVGGPARASHNSNCP